MFKSMLLFPRLRGGEQTSPQLRESCAGPPGGLVMRGPGGRRFLVLGATGLCPATGRGEPLLQGEAIERANHGHWLGLEMVYFEDFEDCPFFVTGGWDGFGW